MSDEEIKSNIFYKKENNVVWIDDVIGRVD